MVPCSSRVASRSLLMLCVSMAAWVELAALLLGARAPLIAWADEDPAVTRLFAVALVRVAESS